MRPVGVLPYQVEIGDETEYKNQIERTLADDLISDADIAAFGVSGFRRRHGLLPLVWAKGYSGIADRRRAIGGPGSEAHRLITMPLMTRSFARMDASVVPRIEKMHARINCPPKNGRTTF